MSGIKERVGSQLARARSLDQVLDLCRDRVIKKRTLDLVKVNEVNDFSKIENTLKQEWLRPFALKPSFPSSSSSSLGFPQLLSVVSFVFVASDITLLNSGVEGISFHRDST